MAAIWIAGRPLRSAVDDEVGPVRLVGKLRRHRCPGLRHSYSPVALILVLSLLALVPLAEASPPDPVWIEGMYDGADHDEVVGIATSLAGVVELCLIVDLFLISLARRSPANTSDLMAAVFAACQGRSPPTLLHSVAS